MDFYPKVKIYTKPDCPYCSKAKALLDMLGLEYIELVKDRDFNGHAYKDRLWPTYPCVVIDGDIIGGYKELSDWILNNGYIIK